MPTNVAPPCVDLLATLRQVWADAIQCSRFVAQRSQDASDNHDGMRRRCVWKQCDMARVAVTYHTIDACLLGNGPVFYLRVHAAAIMRHVSSDSVFARLLLVAEERIDPVFLHAVCFRFGIEPSDRRASDRNALDRKQCRVQNIFTPRRHYRASRRRPQRKQRRSFRACACGADCTRPCRCSPPSCSTIW